MFVLKELYDQVYGTEQERLERCIALQNIILDHWKILPQPMKKEITKVWNGEDRAIFNRSFSRKEK